MTEQLDPMASPMTPEWWEALRVVLGRAIRVRGVEPRASSMLSSFWWRFGSHPSMTPALAMSILLRRFRLDGAADPSGDEPE